MDRARARGTGQQASCGMTSKPGASAPSHSCVWHSPWPKALRCPCFALHSMQWCLPDASVCASSTQIMAQTQTFILAGYETTANALAFTIYLVSTHPHVQVRKGQWGKCEVGHGAAAPDCQLALYPAPPAPASTLPLTFLTSSMCFPFCDAGAAAAGRGPPAAIAVPN